MRCLLVCRRFKQQSIFYQIKITNQIMIINMVQNWHNKYFNNYRIVKYIGFKSIHYVINLNVASFFKFFSEFDSVFLSNVLLV